MLRIKTKSAENLRLGTEYNGQLRNAVTRQAFQALAFGEGWLAFRALRSAEAF